MEVKVMNNMLAVFLRLVCRIPFTVLDNPFFRRFITALRPTFAKLMVHQTALMTTLMEEVKPEDTGTNTYALLDSVPT